MKQKTKWSDCRDAFAKHPREVSCLSAAEDVESVWSDGKEWSLAALWAIDAARRFVCGESDVEECADAADAAYAYAAAAYAAYAAYAADAVYAAAATADYRRAINRLPSKPGKWGPWRESHGLAMAGDYLWRVDEARFLDRDELTDAELVALDGLLEAA